MTFDITPFRAEYPFQSHHVEVRQNVRMHYLDEGKGSPLVMLHGNPTWSFYWRKLVGALSNEYRCIAPDHVGCGLSDKPDDAQYPYVLEQRVDDLELLLSHLGVTREITLVLHDWGGMIGLAFAMRHPDRIKRLVVLNTAGFGLPQGRTLPWQIAVVKKLPFFPVPVRAFGAFSHGANLTCTVRPGRMTPLVKRAYLAPYDSWAHRIAVQRFVEDIPLNAYHPSYRTVERVATQLEHLRGMPTLIMWGRRDFVFDDAFLAEWKKRLPDAEVHAFDDVGHYVMEDAPDEVISLTRSFLQRHPLPRLVS